MDREDDIRQWIDMHEEELVRDIGELVKIPSVSRPGQEQSDDVVEAAHSMIKIAAQYGFHTENCDNRCVKIFYGDGESEVQTVYVQSGTHETPHRAKVSKAGGPVKAERRWL